MIRRITSILNEAVVAMPVGVRVPFAEVIDGVPSKHAGGGQFVPVINDAAGGVSYWRANGAQQVEALDPTASCGDAVRVSVPITFVAFVRREQCDAPDELLNSAAHQLRASLRAVRNSIQGAFGVGVDHISLGVDVARTGEIKDFIVPTSLVVLTLSCVVFVDASADCLERCGEPYDLVCAVIDKASNTKVVACLGPVRVAEICDSDCPTTCEVVQDSDPIEIVDCMPHDWVTPALQRIMEWNEATGSVIAGALGNADKVDDVRPFICIPCPPATRSYWRNFATGG